MLPLAKVKEAFNKFKSVDHRKQVECLRPQDVQFALWELNINPIGADLNEAIRSADANADGIIEWSEFKQLYADFYHTLSDPPRSVSMFKVLDDDGNGVLTQEELRKFLLRHEGGLSELEFEKFWLSLAGDAGEDVSAAEFVHSVCPGVTRDEILQSVKIYYPRAEAAWRLGDKKTRPKTPPPPPPPPPPKQEEQKAQPAAQPQSQQKAAAPPPASGNTTQQKEKEGGCCVMV